MSLVFSIEEWTPNKLMAKAVEAYENQNEAMLDWVDAAVHEYFVICMLDRRFDLIPDFAKALLEFCKGVHGLFQRIVETSGEAPECYICERDMCWAYDEWHCFECDGDDYDAHKQL